MKPSITTLAVLTAALGACESLRSPAELAITASIDVGYGPNLFYYLRHDPASSNFSTFGTISTSGAVTDRFGVGANFDALTFVAEDLGYGPSLFYYLRHDPASGNFSTFGTIATSGAVTDRFGVGANFDALTFVAEDLGYGSDLFYYLRHDPASGNFSTFGTIATSGAVTDRFGVGANFDALTFVAEDLGYGSDLFYFLRHDPAASNFSTFGTIATSGAVTDRFGVGANFDALTFAVGSSAPPPPPTMSIDIKPGESPNSINPRSKGRIAVAILTTTEFDATTVNPATVRFGRTGTEATPVHVTTGDVNEDGLTDLILQFNTQATGIACGDTSARLTAETAGGEEVQAADAIVTVGCGKGGP